MTVLNWHLQTLLPAARAKVRAWRLADVLGWGLGGLLLLIAMFLSWSCFSNVGSVETALLKDENARQRETNLTFESRIRRLQDQLSAYEDRTRRLAIAAGIELQESQAQAGVGGQSEAGVTAQQTSSDQPSGRPAGAEAPKQELLLRTLVAPVRGVFTSGFGYRSDPLTHSPGAHSGIDIAASASQPVLASARGIVYQAQWMGPLGMAVSISHGFGLTTTYGHLSHIDVRRGQQVRQGDVIGRVGNTGRSTGTHLHFEVRVEGVPVDPWSITGFQSTPLPDRALALTDAQGLLDDETLLLSYRLGDERSFLWVVSRDSIESHELPPRKEIESAVARAYVALSASDRRVTRASSELAIQSLGKMLLDPAVDSLGSGRHRLAIVSEGAIQYIPFAELPDPARPSKPLVADHEIVVLPAASTLQALRQRAQNHPRPTGLLAVIADPVYQRTDPRILARGGLEPTRAVSLAEPRPLSLPRLVSSEREAQEILRLTSGEPTLAALGFSANRDLATSGVLSRYRILHFATHGLLNAEHPGIVLSLVDERGRSREGILEASEIRRLSLPVDLVVLSACQTALGREISGEGLEALPQSFLDAGALRVVASLWNVDDQATAVFMSRFYQALLSRGLAPAAALREAQLSMLREPRWSAPFYWAGFVLIGDWR